MINETDSSLRAAERAFRASGDPESRARLQRASERAGDTHRATKLDGEMGELHTNQSEHGHFLHTIKQGGRTLNVGGHFFDRFKPVPIDQAHEAIVRWFNSTGHNPKNPSQFSREYSDNVRPWSNWCNGRPQDAPVPDALLKPKVETMDFFSIYSSIGRRGGHMTEAALSVDSNRDVTSRGNSHTDKTLSPELRDKVLTARIQEIEAFAKDRGIEPLIAMGASEAALRTGRVPNLTMYGLGGDSMVALKHFIAGEILNLAGMEAINWDGTPIEEADAAPPSHHAIATRLSGVVERHFLKDLNGVKDEETGAFRKFRTKLQGHIKSLLKGGKYDTSDPHWRQLHIALASNQNEVLSKDAPESINNFVNSDREDKSDQGKPQERWGVPKEEDDPNDQKRKGGKVGGPKPQLSHIEIAGQIQQEYAADRGGSALSNMSGVGTSNKPAEAGKQKIQGDMSKQTIARIKKGQSEVQRNEKTGEKGDKKAPMMATDLNGLSGKDVGKLGRELGAMGTGETGESVEIKNKDLLNIEPGDFRNETWPKMSNDLKRLLNVESSDSYLRESKKTAWEALAPSRRSEFTGWSKSNEFHCAHCGTQIGKNLKGEPPFKLAQQHLHTAHGGKDLSAAHEDINMMIDEGNRALTVGRPTGVQATVLAKQVIARLHPSMPEHHREAAERLIHALAPYGDRLSNPHDHIHDVMPNMADGMKKQIADRVHEAVMSFASAAKAGKRSLQQASVDGANVSEMMGAGSQIRAMWKDEQKKKAYAAKNAANAANRAALANPPARPPVAPAQSQTESTLAGSVGSFMQLGNQIVARPNTIATWDASVDVNGFKPARLGMITPDPVVALEARRYRDADAAAEFIANKKLNTKFNDAAFALHKGDDGSVHVQIRGADGKDGTHPSEDPGNEGKQFHELTRGERGKFLPQPAGVKKQTATTMTGVPGVRKTVEPDTKRNKAMNAIRTLRAAAAAIK